MIQRILTGRRMTGRTLSIAVLAACIAVSGVYFGFFHQAKAGTPSFATVSVRRADLEDVVTALGKLEPATYVDVGAQVSGQLMKLHVDIGSVVKKGDLLAEIDPRSLLSKVEADKATLANLEATLAERKAKLAQAERNYKRDARLRKQNAASELSAQTSETEYKVLVAQVKAVDAQIRQAKATLDSDELNLSYAKIYAPIAGTVVSLSVKEGQTLNNNQTAPTLLRLAELEVMTVWASVSEADVNKILPGMDVYFTTIGDSATRYYTKVQKILPSYTEENDVIMYDVIFDVENPKGIFLPAMNTQVFFVRGQAKDALFLPAESLTSVPGRVGGAGGAGGGDSAQLTVLLPNGKQEVRTVTLGVRTRTAVQVVEGLAEGETIKVAASAKSRASGGMRPMTPRL